MRPSTCLIRKLGIADEEFTTNTGDGHVHMYSGNGSPAFRAGFAGDSVAWFPLAMTLWNSVENLSRYDIVIFSCEGDQMGVPKTASAMQALFDYSNLGGRVFLSHWHNVWLEGNTQQGRPATIVPPAPWPSIASFKDEWDPIPDGTIASVDESHPLGPPFALWLLNMGASTTRDQLVLSGAKGTCESIDQARATQWVYWNPDLLGGMTGVQMFEFTTPNDAEPKDRCGKVAFSDMHVSQDSLTGGLFGTIFLFPDGCADNDLTPPEKALAFMIFEISACVVTVN